MKLKQSPLAKAYFLSTLALGATLSILLTVVDVFLLLDEGENELGLVHQRLLSSYSEPIAHALWVLDTQQIQAQLNGILALPEVDHVELLDTELAYRAGELLEGESSVSSSPIYYRFQGEAVRLATLQVHSPLSHVYQQTFIQAARRVGFNVLQTVPVLLVSFYFFNTLVNQRLRLVSEHIRKGGFLSQSPEALRLKRPFFMRTQSDEIEQIADELNHLSAEAAGLSATLNAMSDWVVTLNQRGELYHVNRSALSELFRLNDLQTIEGLPFEQALRRRRWRWAGARKQEDRKLLEQVKVLAKGGKPFELTLVSPERANRHFLLSGAEIHDQRGGVSGWVLIFRDITQEVELQSCLKKSEKFLTLGQLSSGIAHDFNNALAGIVSSTELLQDSPTACQDKQAKRLLNIINKSSASAAELVSKLLAFSRSNQVKLAPLSLHELSQDVVEILSNTLSQGVCIQLDNHTEKGVIHGDQAALQNMLMNLCINANKAMNKGGLITITLHDVSVESLSVVQRELLGSAKKAVQIAICDNGSGIAEEHLSKVFDPFFTTRSGTGGTGLGLATVYRTVMEHGGCIWVESKVGIGTCFYIVLPTSPDELPTTPSFSEQKVFLRAGRVLLVEDDALVRESTKAQLERLGLSVRTGANGEQGLALYLAEPDGFDLVVSDFDMPALNGADFLQRLRQHGCQVPCIIYSGFIDEHSVERLDALGVSARLQKPLRLAELAASIDRALPSEVRALSIHGVVG